MIGPTPVHAIFSEDSHHGTCVICSTELVSDMCYARRCARLQIGMQSMRMLPRSSEVVATIVVAMGSTPGQCAAHWSTRPARGTRSLRP